MTTQAATAATRPPLGTPFWRLFAATGSSNLGDGLQLAAVPLLAATLTRDPFAISVIGALAFLPWLLFALPAGALVDRIDHRRAMAAANLTRATLLAAMGVVVATGHESVPLLYVLTFALGCAETIHDTASRAMLPHVVVRAALERGNSLLATAESVANLFLGSPVGAFLFTLYAAFPFWVMGILYLAAAALIIGVAGRFRPERTTKTSFGRDMADGIGHLRDDRLLRSLLGATGLNSLAQAVGNAVFILYVLQVMHLGERWFGLLLTGVGVGAIVGALVSPTLTNRLGRTTAMGLSTLVPALGLVAMGAAPGLQTGIVGAVAQGMGVAAFNVQVMSVRQAVIPHALFGRVNGAYRTVLWGGIPLGALAGGAIARNWTVPSTYVVAGVLAVISAVATWWVLHRHAQTIADAFATQPEDQPVDEPPPAARL